MLTVQYDLISMNRHNNKPLQSPIFTQRFLMTEAPPRRRRVSGEQEIVGEKNLRTIIVGLLQFLRRKNIFSGNGGRIV